MTPEHIIIRGARQHNLKNVTVKIPRNTLTIVTGLSGSGKSSLAFDTLYAEGQRRYVESLSAYARQFLERMEKPDVDMIDGLSPAIAIEQKTASHNPRSTVGTVTEIYDYLRLLFARVGTPHCYQCGSPITSQTLDETIDHIMTLPERTKIIILAPLIENRKGSHEALIKKLKRDGFARIQVDSKTIGLENVTRLDKQIAHTIAVVVDRLVIKPGLQNRLADSLELAQAQSGGRVIVDVLGCEPILFNDKAVCPNCNIDYPDFTPASFSFNSPHGACPDCDGLGTTTQFDPHLIVPNEQLSLREGAVVPWAEKSSVMFAEFLDALTTHFDVDIYTPYAELPDSFTSILLNGSGDEKIPFYTERGQRRIMYQKPFEGIIPNLKRRYLETDSGQVREELRQYMSQTPCLQCRGTRLNPASRSVNVGSHTISEITCLSIDAAHAYFSQLRLKGKAHIIASKIVKEITERLGFLANVGLSYLTLDRSAATLSGGESQRIRLATQIGSKLTGVLYVLDEPSIGLHHRDNQRLLQTLLKMRDLGNSVLVVEHDQETILASDYVIEMGPGAGIHGGHVTFTGTPQALLKDDTALTGMYFSGRKQLQLPSRRNAASSEKLIIRGASENNLKNIDVEFPLGNFICVTGVSGSGKSTLVFDILYRVLSRHVYRAKIPAGRHTAVEGLAFIDKVVNIDQSPIGKTPRSNPGTYTGVFTFMREMLAKTPEARLRGYKSGRFSFNVKGGRCEACGGDGIIKIEMHFLPDIYVACDVCQGKRYNRETLDIRYKGKNVVDMLNMTVNQARTFFANIGHITTKLDTLVDVGLGYIHIGQPATTLSGGEAQRVKLARELSKKGTGQTVYILDEPTTGLHIDDIQRLLTVLYRLVEAGNTVIIIEHNLDVIRFADHVIDLGPEGGDQGGNIVGYGTPEEIASIAASYTGQALRANTKLKQA